MVAPRINGDTKMLSKGSSPPPAPNDGLLLLSMRFCPFAERARVVLAAKGIPHNIVNVDLKNKPDWFLEMNPLGKVPVLIEPGNKVTYESLVVAEYIDDTMQGKEKLMPTDPYERARQKMLVERIQQAYIDKFVKLNFKGEDEDKKSVEEGLVKVEELLTDQYFSGSKPGYVDYMIWPFFWRLPQVKEVRSWEPSNKSKLPKVYAWIDRMSQLQPVKETSLPSDVNVGFVKDYIKGQPNYDFGL